MAKTTKDMIAGRLTEFVTLQRPTTVVDRFGARTVVYTTTERVRADVKYKTGSSGVEASEMFPDVRLEVYVRDAHVVSTGWRLIYGDDKFYVGAVEKSRTKGYRRLICDKVNE